MNEHPVQNADGDWSTFETAVKKLVNTPPKHRTAKPTPDEPIVERPREKHDP